MMTTLDAQCGIAEALILIVGFNQDHSESGREPPQPGMSRLKVQRQISSSLASLSTGLAGHCEAHAIVARSQNLKKFAIQTGLSPLWSHFHGLRRRLWIEKGASALHNVRFQSTHCLKNIATMRASGGVVQGIATCIEAQALQPMIGL